MSKLHRIATPICLACVLILVGGCRAVQTTEQPTVQPVATQTRPETPTTRPTVRPTDTSAPPTATAIPPTDTPVPPTATAIPPTDTPFPTDTPVPPTATPEPTPTLSPVARLVADLEGLPLDDFFEESYKQLRLRDPEGMTYDGLAKEYGLRNDQLTNLSDAYVRETQELEAAILDLLRSYDRAKLTLEQLISYDVYEWYLDDLVRGHEFMYYDYPVHHFLGSYHDELIRLLTEIHPLDDKQDAEDYVARLSQVDDQVEQLLKGLKLREEAGVTPPRFIVELAQDEMRRYLGIHSSDPASIEAESLSVYVVFSEKLDEIDALGAQEKQALLDAALAEVKESFVPAYVALLDYVDYLETIATDDAGVWKFPNGDAYYAYILRNQTSTDMTPKEIHELGLAEVVRIKAEMRQVFDELGYPQDASWGELMERAVGEAGYYDIQTQQGKERLIEAYEEMLKEVNQRLDVAFDIRPSAQVIVVGGPMGGYYVPGSRDGSRPGAFHVGIGGSWVPKFNMASVAYHEAIPGHHFQIAIAQELDLPTFRNDIFFNGYGEGWALYAERLAWELGLYDDDAYGNLGRLDLELLRAVRLVVDTGIHAMRWTREQANEYMAQAFGTPPGTSFHEVDRYIVIPAQATGYKIGMLKILELRHRAMDQLGERFDLKEFHNVVLGNGSMPLDVLERVVQDYIDAQSAVSLAQKEYEPVWEPVECRFNVPSDHTPECGDLIVPQDRSQPDGPTVRLHVAVFNSTSPHPAPDPVIHLVGGPGASLLDSAAFYLHAGGNKILDIRDYVMFNQRGTRYATPDLTCPGHTDLLWKLAGQNLTFEERDAREMEFLLDCQGDLFDQGIDLSAYSSAENATDVNDLRIALGYDQVNLYGISYGTRLALTVVRDHPHGIRSVIIDSVHPPLVDLYSEFPVNVARAFNTLFAGCAADAHCNETYPNLETTFYQTVDELDADPVQVDLSRGPVMVDGAHFVDGVFYAMYRTDVIPWIPSMIASASRGNLKAMSGALEALLSMDGISVGMHYSLRCRDEVPFESPEEASALAASLPAQIRKHFAFPFDLTLCQSWQSGQADAIEKEPVVSDIPTLVVSGQYDPITPPAWGALAAETLSNSFYYEFPGIGHGVIRSSECALEIGLQFLDDPTTEPDNSCIDLLDGPDFR